MIQSTSQSDFGVCRTALGLIGIFGTCLKVNFFVIYDPFMSAASPCLSASTNSKLNTRVLTMHLNHRRNKIFTYLFICLFYIGGQFVHFFVLVQKVNSFEKEEENDIEDKQTRTRRLHADR